MILSRDKSTRPCLCQLGATLPVQGDMPCRRYQHRVCLQQRGQHSGQPTHDWSRSRHVHPGGTVREAGDSGTSAHGIVRYETVWATPKCAKASPHTSKVRIDGIQTAPPRSLDTLNPERTAPVWSVVGLWSCCVVFKGLSRGDASSAVHWPTFFCFSLVESLLQYHAPGH